MKTDSPHGATHRTIKPGVIPEHVRQIAMTVPSGKNALRNAASRVLVAVLAAGLIVADTAFATGNSEAEQGDFANTPATPTALGTLLNGQTVLGSVGGSDTDDYLTFSVPDGYRLQSMRLRRYSAADADGSVAIASGASWTAGENTSGLLGFASFGPVEVGADLLATMNVSGSALGAGSYTMRLRRAGAEATYGFDFKLVAVGAPSGEITATPSTVFLLPGQLGATTISWTTSGCASARVTVSTESNPSPGNFAQATSSAGSSAPWISEGRVT